MAWVNAVGACFGSRQRQPRGWRAYSTETGLPLADRERCESGIGEQFIIEDCPALAATGLVYLIHLNRANSRSRFPAIPSTSLSFLSCHSWTIARLPPRQPGPSIPLLRNPSSYNRVATRSPSRWPRDQEQGYRRGGCESCYS